MALFSRKFLLIVVLLFVFPSAESSEDDDSNKVGVEIVVEGELKLIPCVGEDVLWYKPGTDSDLLQSPDKTENNLVLKSPAPADEGIYVCKKDDDSVIRKIKVIVIPKCPDFATADSNVLGTFLDSQQFNDTRRGLIYGECLKKAVTWLINKQEELDNEDETDANKDENLKEMEKNLTNTQSQLKDARKKLKKKQNDYNVTMQAEADKIPPGGDLDIWCKVTDSEGNYTFQWFWAAGDGYDFDWPPGLSKSNATSEKHYSKFHAQSADIAWSGSFFCLVEKNGGDDAPRLYHVEVEVAYPIQSLHLIRNRTHYNQTVPIEIPHGSPLKVNCTATGKWAPPGTVNIAAHIGNESVISGNETLRLIDPVNKTATAKLTIPWKKIEGKNVNVSCEAKGDYKSNRSINATVEVLNPIQSLHLSSNGKHSNRTVPIEIPHGSPLEVNCTATGLYTAPGTVNIAAHIIGSESVILGNKSHIDPDARTTTAELTIPWEKIEGKNVNVSCEAKGDYKSIHSINAKVEVSSATPSPDEPPKEDGVPATTTDSNTTSGIFATPTVFGGIATILVVVVVIGVVVVAYRSRDKLRSWIMEKDVSKAALRKAKYARAKGGRGWIKYAKLPRDISEAMSHNE